MWVRVDNRLVHGQVIEAWLPYTQADAIWVASDDLAGDPLRQEIMSLAIPQSVAIRFYKVSAVAKEYKKAWEEGKVDILFLFSTCQEAKLAHESGLHFSIINIGNIHYSTGRTQVCEHVSVNKDDISCLQYFNRSGVEIDFRCVPNKPVQVRPLW